MSASFSVNYEDGVEGGAYISIESLPNVIDWRFDQRSHSEVYTSVIYEQVNTVVCRSGDFFERSFDGFWIGDVQLNTFYPGGKFAKRLNVASGSKDSVRFLGVKFDGHRSTETGGAAGDYDYLTRVVGCY